jgi:RNA polymerase sigma factor (sigma-70 family)
LLDSARAGGDNAEAALQELSRRYYRPIYAYLAALARDGERALDLTQSFFAERVLNRQVLMDASPVQGSFRHYLRRTVRNFFLDEVRGEASIRRGGGAAQSRSNEAEQLAEVHDWGNPELAFHTEWVRSHLETALARVEALCAEREQVQHFEIFLRRYLGHADPPPTWAEIGEPFGIDARTAQGRAETVARHFQLVLRGMFKVELGRTRNVDQELAALHALLSR